MSEIHLVHKSANFIHFLFEKAQTQMDRDDLEWVSGCDNFALEELESLSKVIENTGCLIADDKGTGSFGGPEDAANLLFSLKHQIDTLTGILYVSKEARYRLNNWEFCKRRDAAKAQAARSANQATDKTKPA